MRIEIPDTGMVVLVGPSGSGKTTMAHKHFLPTEILSSDVYRGMVSDDQENMAATDAAFASLHFVAGQRLSLGKRVVVDATNLRPENRRSLLKIAAEHHRPAIAVVLQFPERHLLEQNDKREPGKGRVHRRVIQNQKQQLRTGLRWMDKEGYQKVYTLNKPEDLETLEVVRQRLANDKRDEHGPLDIIGDIHGCALELTTLLLELGYKDRRDEDGNRTGLLYHPAGRKVVFVGDLFDRGPYNMVTAGIVSKLVESGSGYLTLGNHDDKFLRWLRGRKVQPSHGLDITIDEAEKMFETFPGTKETLIKLLSEAPDHLVFDDGKLVVAHAGLPERLHGRVSREVHSFALYGDTDGTTDAAGFPIRKDWALTYRGAAAVVYGHTYNRRPQWLNNTINIDTGCVGGDRLTTLRYPERELVSVKSAQAYYEMNFPAETEETLTQQQQDDQVLVLEEVLGQRGIETQLAGRVNLSRVKTSATVEALSTKTVDPRWLVYIPPTMSPSDSAAEEGMLEHPTEAFAYFQSQGVTRVTVEDKHMGSRAIVIACRNRDAARERFGIETGETGVVYTRRGNPFFDNAETNQAVLDEVREAATKANLWEELNTEWLLLDCELMPWSAKGQGLLTGQYAPMAVAGIQSAKAAEEAVLTYMSRALQNDATSESLGQSTPVSLRLSHLNRSLNQFRNVYREYCWKVDSPADLKLAPFHLLATEGKVHSDQTHEWHMDWCSKLTQAGTGILFATDYRTIHVEDEVGKQQLVEEWERKTLLERAEGMVFKPETFLARNPENNSIVQPALKCRGREYLRIIYGPDYTEPGNLERIKNRSTHKKRQMAYGQFVVGLEGLERFVRREPLRQVHECALGVLSLDSESVDPRL